MHQDQLTIAAATGRRTTFPGRVFLAPMEGITDATFRGLVIDLGGVGGACTDFVRVAGAPVGVAALRRRLGPGAACPVGLQLMAGRVDEHLVATAATAEAAGAAFVDLNIGCPAPKVFNNCAGSALLARPEQVAALIAATVAATPLPVSAKLRVGIDDDALLDDLVVASAEAGAAAVALHARRRVDPYTRPARWAWIARAVATLHRVQPGVPLIGNGSVRTPADARRMIAETGCDAVMIGIGALADPFVFRAAAGGPPATPQEAVAFARRYAAAMVASGGRRSATGRFKQMIRVFTAGGLFVDHEDDRHALLREGDLDRILAWFDHRLTGLGTESTRVGRATS